MRILCIEDYDEKFEHIQEVLKEVNYNLVWKKSYQAGLTELRLNSYDIVLLDMSMPINELELSRDNFDNFAGLSILREIKRRKYDLKVILVTGFSDFEKGLETITLNELENEINEKFAEIYIGCVHYDSTSVEWQEKLLSLLKGRF